MSSLSADVHRRLAEACRQGDLEALARAFDDAGNLKDEYGTTPHDLVTRNQCSILREALDNGNVEVTRALIERVDAKDHDVRSALNIGYKNAVDDAHIDLARLLTAEFGVDPFYKERYVLRTRACQRKKDFLEMIFRDTGVLDASGPLKGQQGGVDGFLAELLEGCASMVSEELRDVVLTVFSEIRRRGSFCLDDASEGVLDETNQEKRGVPSCILAAIKRKDASVLDAILDGRGWSGPEIQKVCQRAASTCDNRLDMFRHLLARSKAVKDSRGFDGSCCSRDRRREQNEEVFAGMSENQLVRIYDQCCKANDFAMVRDVLGAMPFNTAANIAFEFLKTSSDNKRASVCSPATNVENRVRMKALSEDTSHLRQNLRMPYELARAHTDFGAASVVEKGYTNICRLPVVFRAFLDSVDALSLATEPAFLALETRLLDKTTRIGLHPQRGLLLRRKTCRDLPSEQEGRADDFYDEADDSGITLGRPDPIVWRRLVGATWAFARNEIEAESFYSVRNIVPEFMCLDIDMNRILVGVNEYSDEGRVMSAPVRGSPQPYA